ncbi:MAG: hypothetical protein SOZ27_02435 [Spirochaetia bacterium]|nr:hypothetical protein [Spirochaetia bacterium]
MLMILNRRIVIGENGYPESIRVSGCGMLEADGYMEYCVAHKSDFLADASVTLQYEMKKEFPEMVMGLHGNAVKIPCLKIYRWGFPRDSF